MYDWTSHIFTLKSLIETWPFGQFLLQNLLIKKGDLLKVYGSQRDVLDWFSPWYEVITKVNK